MGFKSICCDFEHERHSLIIRKRFELCVSVYEQWKHRMSWHELFFLFVGFVSVILFSHVSWDAGERRWRKIFMCLSEIRLNHILNWYVYIYNVPFSCFRFIFLSLVPVVTMEALIGETIYLPCNVSTHDVNDDVVLVLWYRADKGTPVYR